MTYVLLEKELELRVPQPKLTDSESVKSLKRFLDKHPIITASASEILDESNGLPFTEPALRRLFYLIGNPDEGSEFDKKLPQSYKDTMNGSDRVKPLDLKKKVIRNILGNGYDAVLLFDNNNCYGEFSFSSSLTHLTLIMSQTFQLLKELRKIFICSH